MKIPTSENACSNLILSSKGPAELLRGSGRAPTADARAQSTSVEANTDRGFASPGRRAGRGGFGLARLPAEQARAREPCGAHGAARSACHAASGDQSRRRRMKEMSRRRHSERRSRGRDELRSELQGPPSPPRATSHAPRGNTVFPGIIFSTIGTWPKANITTENRGRPFLDISKEGPCK